jgi:hypothetical protein
MTIPLLFAALLAARCSVEREIGSPRGIKVP